MPSHDLRIIIERYSIYNEDQKLIHVSWGCPGLDLMGYSNLEKLFMAIENQMAEQGKL